MYSFLITNASKLIYGSLIAIALYACWNVYDNYQDMKQTITSQSKVITTQKLQLETLAKVASDNADMYHKAKAEAVYLTEQIFTLNTRIAKILNQQTTDISTVKEEIDNAPQEIKECLRRDLPDSIVSSLRQHTKS